MSYRKDWQYKAEPEMNWWDKLCRWWYAHMPDNMMLFGVAIVTIGIGLLALALYYGCKSDAKRNKGKKESSEIRVKCKECTIEYAGFRKRLLLQPEQIAPNISVVKEEKRLLDEMNKWCKRMKAD